MARGHGEGTVIAPTQSNHLLADRVRVHGRAMSACIQYLHAAYDVTLEYGACTLRFIRNWIIASADYVRARFDRRSTWKTTVDDHVDGCEFLRVGRHHGLD